MDRTEKLKNDILVGMRVYLDSTQLSILNNVVMMALRGIKITEMETLPATTNDTNEYIKEIFLARKGSKLSARTVEFYMETIDELLLVVNKTLTEIKSSDIEYYLYMKQKAGNTNCSLNNRRRNISAFYTWMRKAKLVTENPCDGIEPYSEPEKPIDHLEPDETEDIKTGCIRKRDRAIIEFMRCTAMRRGEVPAVKINDIDFGTGKILIYGQKSKKYRTVYLDKVALKYIKEYIKERNESYDSNAPLFATLHGDKGLSGDGLYSAIKAIGKRSQCQHNLYPHLFRKTCATTIVKRGGSDDMAGDYLGHAPKNVTGRHYISKDEKHIENIFRNCVAAV